MTTTSDGYQAPTDDELRVKSLNFIRGCQPRDYRQMRKDGELQEYLDLSAKACRRYAESLIHGGMWAGEAWNLAIRQEILHSESD